MSRLKLLVVCGCAVLLGAAFYISSDKPKFKAKIIPTYSTPLGNKLSAYFYYINTYNVQDRYLINEHKLHLARLSDPLLKKFYQQWPWVIKREIKKNHIDYISAPVSAHEQLADGVQKAGYLQFWQTIRPQISVFYKHRLRTNLIQDPVVHFRCSDSPFNKHTSYHLTKATTVDWMAQQLVERGYKNIIMLSCNQYRSLDQQSCAKYIEFYTQIFTTAGLQVTQQCNSVLHDFELMVSAPVLVSLNYSSFSFMAGIAKDPQNYISCNGGQEIPDGVYVAQTAADWVLSHDLPLLHNEVRDYNDTSDVIARLKH